MKVHSIGYRENGSSVAMEKEGLRRCLTCLLDKGLSIDTIATDRHQGVGALMKADYPTLDTSMMSGTWLRVLLNS